MSYFRQLYIIIELYSCTQLILEPTQGHNLKDRIQLKENLSFMCSSLICKSNLGISW